VKLLSHSYTVDAV